MSVVRVGIFAVGTLGLAWVSRRSLWRLASHGLYRFFAWEAILGLLVLNFRGLPAWFADPLSARQIASWILLASSMAVLVPGVHALRGASRSESDETRPDPLAFERTTALVTTGVFGYIRHPLYASLLFLAWGVLLKRPGWSAATVTLLATVCLFATARAEEAEDLRYFGESYRAYMRRTKMFVPFLL